MAPKMDPKSMKNRGCVADAFLERFWRSLGGKMSEHLIKTGSLLAIIFHQNSKKRHPKRHAKIDAEKVLEIDAKRLSK